MKTKTNDVSGTDLPVTVKGQKAKKPTAMLVPAMPSGIMTLWDDVKTRLRRNAEEMAKTVEKMIALGEKLATERKNLPYGQFGTWLEAHFGGGASATAYRYMNLANLAKIITVRKLTEAVLHGVPLNFLYSFNDTMATSSETITLAENIDLVATYRILRQKKSMKQATQKRVSTQTGERGALPPRTNSAPITSQPPLAQAPSTEQTSNQEDVRIPTALATPASNGSMNIPGFPLPIEVYKQLRQLQDQFRTSTIPATITRLVERAIRAQKIGKLIQVKAMLTEKMNKHATSK